MKVFWTQVRLRCVVVATTRGAFRVWADERRLLINWIYDNAEFLVNESVLTRLSLAGPCGPKIQTVQIQTTSHQNIKKFWVSVVIRSLCSYWDLSPCNEDECERAILHHKTSCFHFQLPSAGSQKIVLLILNQPPDSDFLHRLWNKGIDYVMKHHRFIYSW